MSHATSGVAGELFSCIFVLHHTNMGEDFKLIFYIVVAIGWVIFKNFRKITKEAQGRDFTKPVNQSPAENWPPVKMETPAPVPVPKPVPTPKVKRQFLHKQPIRQSRQTFLTSDIPPVEGGVQKPSSSAVFATAPEPGSESIHPWLEEFRTGMDWRKAMVAAEILQRPYK